MDSNSAKPTEPDSDRLTESEARQTAANDSQGGGPRKELPFSLRDLTHLAQVCRTMLDAPKDLPLEDLALHGLELAVSALATLHPGARALAQRIDEVKRQQPLGVVEGATLLALQRRLGRHQLYMSAVAIARANRAGAVDPIVLQTMGARFVLRIFRDVQPSPKAMAVAIAAISSPKGPHAMAWSDKGRARALSVAERQLRESLDGNPQVAASFGLIESAPRVVRSMEPIDVFNREFRRRSENLEDYASQAMIGAAGGYGTLSPNLLRDAGVQLLSMVKTGDAAAALVCLETVSHLTSEIALKLPLQLGSLPPAGALAWLNVEVGCYCYTLYKIIERAARPEAETKDLYEVTTQIVTILLTPPLADFFRAAVRAATTTPRNVGDLVGDVGHHPRSAVVGECVYRITARRLQESVPALLIKAGHHRWPVALVTNSFFAVARGRPVYGACRSQTTDRTTVAACAALGWPAPQLPERTELIGSFTAIKPESVQRAFEFLFNRAEEAGNLASVGGAIECLKCHASWIAAFLALVLALRRWLEYNLDGDELRSGAACRVLDKDVHAQQGLAIPLVGLVGPVMRGWDALVERVAIALDRLGDPRSVALARLLWSWLGSGRKDLAIFSVDAADRLEAIGYLTWNSVLPQNLRVRPNFARQLWPLQLMERGIEQLLIDVLTRHQIDGIYIGSSNRVSFVEGDMARLRAAMEDVIAALLRIAVPSALKVA